MIGTEQDVATRNRQLVRALADAQETLSILAAGSSMSVNTRRTLALRSWHEIQEVLKAR